MLEKLRSDMKEAMKARDEEKLQTLRMALASLKNEEIALGHPLAEEEILNVLSREVKQRKQSAEEFLQAGRKDLAEKELREASILQGYLPKLLEGEELEQAIREILDEEKPANFGLAMKAVMGRLKNRAEGKKVQDIIKKIFS